MAKRFLWVAIGMLIGAAGYALAQQAAKEGNSGLKQRVLLEQVLPEQLDGKDAKVTALEFGLLLFSPQGLGGPSKATSPKTASC